MALFNNSKRDAARELIISYKRTFGSKEGKEVLFDLMNRFHILNPAVSEIAEGQRQTVLHILKQSNVNLKQLDELMKGNDHDDSFE